MRSLFFPIVGDFLLGLDNIYSRFSFLVRSEDSGDAWISLSNLVGSGKCDFHIHFSLLLTRE